MRFFYWDKIIKHLNFEEIPESIGVQKKNLSIMELR